MPFAASSPCWRSSASAAGCSIAVSGSSRALCYAGSCLPFFYFRTGIIDPWYNLFTFLSVTALIRYAGPDPPGGGAFRFLAESALFLGLAVLTKGPAAVLVFGLTLAVMAVAPRVRWRRRVQPVVGPLQFLQPATDPLRPLQPAQGSEQPSEPPRAAPTRFRPLHGLAFLLIFGLVASSWFLSEIAKGRASLIGDFLRYQRQLFLTPGAGHGGFLLYHFVVLLIGVFPSSVLALPVLFRGWSIRAPRRRVTGVSPASRQVAGSPAAAPVAGLDSVAGSPPDPSRGPATSSRDRYQEWMKALFWVVLILFTIVRTKIIHYSSLCYFPLTFLAAVQVNALLGDNRTPGRAVSSLLTSIGGCIALVAAAIPLVDVLKGPLIAAGWIKDGFVLGQLRMSGGWTVWDELPAAILFGGLLIYWILRRSTPRAVLYLYGVTLGFMLSALLLLVPRIERYTQGPAIDFYESMAGKPVTVSTLGFKSYAQLFYFRKPPPNGSEARTPESLLTGPIDRDAWFVAKVTQKARYLAEHPELKLVGEEGGFVFLLRPRLIRPTGRPM